MKIAIIRIKGMVGIRKDIKETLYRLRLRKKYACVVIEDTSENLGMLKKIRDFVAFGEINDETYKELVTKRGKMQKTKSSASFAEASSNERKNAGTLKGISEKLKPFFRLHPPRGGIDSKKHFGVKKGVLGNNGKEINNLILRML